VHQLIDVVGAWDLNKANTPSGIYF